MRKVNYFNIFKEAIEERGLKVADLENAKILNKGTFYNFSRNCPSLLNAIKIANYIEMSLDYILGRTDTNNFKRYDSQQDSLFELFESILKTHGVTKYRIGKDLGIADSTFLRWKNGSTLKLSTIIELAQYLRCDIDEFLKHE